MDEHMKMVNFHEIAAQLWCLPENARTQFDSTLCCSIAEALRAAASKSEKDGWNKAVEECVSKAKRSMLEGTDVILELNSVHKDFK